MKAAPYPRQNGETAMKQVLSGLLLTVLISLGAWGMSQYFFVTPASEVGTSPNQTVRLD